MAKKPVIATLMLLLAIFCISPLWAADAAKPINPEDPYEPFNRVMFAFNDRVDQFVLKPLATVYNKVLPKPLTKGLSNFFSNIDTIPTVINDVLQGNFYQASNDAWRLMLNTTIGIVGLWDPSSRIGLDPNSEDLGLTFARWGFTDSNYLVLPFIGPSTVRDGLAWPINYNFFTIYPYITPVRARYELYGLSLITKRADLLRYQDVLQQATLDKYTFMRNAYLQKRNYLIQRNRELGDPYLEDTSSTTATSPKG